MIGNMLSHLTLSVLLSQLSYPEGPLFTADFLYFVEYGKDRVVRSSGSGIQEFWKEKGCGPASVIQRPSGNFLVACYDQNRIVEVSMDGNTLRDFRFDLSGNELKAPNDFCLDSKGGVYFTSSGVFEAFAPVEGKVFHMSEQSEIRQVAQGIHYSNGVAVSNDQKTLYVSEHLKNRIIQFSIEENGVLKEPTVFSDLSQFPSANGILQEPRLGPDGIEMGREGSLYVAQYGGGRILKLNGDGQLLTEYRFDPYFYITNLAINQSDQMVVTGMSHPEGGNESGALFLLDLKVDQGSFNSTSTIF
jgi:gluconolactonase